ncbi:DUF402 domain-containing protein [Sulfolobus sp. E11-6]|uniref:DUF402 domain-containing protein n=1 Tax=Sulfolobus sp. E11-6 TaxID=2663020 RepID=UPI0012961E97|nr:DUF402 domain-containing protein [Sulfolobus sp. E11-6]QGA69300.1 DUF402 domain-containing protein [Sulfolobus sp. E11-6]
MKGRVRIRGIYATALTSIFSSLSYEIVQQSIEIAERFMQEINNSPADITIKDFEDDRGKIIVMGNGIIEEDLHSIFKYSFHWRSPIKLYSIIETEESCTYLNFKVEPCLKEGIVTKPPYDGKMILGETKAVSKYAMVWRGKGITTFSEHIRDEEERLRLLSLSSPLNRKGYNVKWRSNAKYATLNELKEDLERLVMKYENREFKDQGEDFHLITLSLPDKLQLDEVRKSVVDTVKYHHMLKLSYNREIDSLEKNKEGSPGKLLEALISDFMKIEHIKANGKVIYLRGGKVIEKEVNDNGYRIVLRREFTSNGILDGIGKRIEDGDYDIVEYNSNKWYQIHKYYSGIDNSLKGVYINISTPPELLRGKIRYLDLEIDIAIKDSETLVLDEDELTKKSIYMPSSLVNRTKEVANYLLNQIRQNGLI